MSRVAVVGAGAWGTALAVLEARAGRPVALYARDPAAAEAMERSRANERFLPGVALPAGLAVTADLAQALAGAGTILLVVPTQALRDVARTLRPHLQPGACLVLCSKGIERDTGLFASAVVASELPASPVAVLSGPSFAADVAAGLPTAVTLACRDAARADALSRDLSTDTFRIYAATDVLGVEAGGALKNVLAIAAGAVAGRGLGASAGAAMVTRGLNELRRLGEALGAEPGTLMGLSGLGDLVLTCGSAQSRNFAYGFALGRGDDLAGLKLAEGIFSAGIAAELARRHGIEAPIVATVAAVLDGRLSVEAAVQSLLARPLKRESD